jgi:carbamoyltransferase
MYILGINAYHADASAALFHKGKLVAATEEERFTRIKHWAGFPEQAIRFCLQEAGITLAQVDYITIGRDPKAKFFRKIRFVVRHPSAGFFNLKTRLKNAREVESLEFMFSNSFPNLQRSDLSGKIRHIEHHRSHLASAFFASPFEESAILSIDGSGDFTTTMIAHGKGRDIDVLDSVDFPHSVGLFYTAMTQYLGFPHYGDEYKVMGLAPYGKPTYADQLLRMVRLKSNGLFELDLSYFNIFQTGIIHYGDDHKPNVATLFSRKVEILLGKARSGNDPLTQEHKNIASSIQFVTEKIYMHLLNGLYNRTGLKAICIAGGVAQNSVANGKVIAQTKFNELYIPSAGHDAGISMGSALYHYNANLKQDRQPAIRSAFTGARFSNEEIEKCLDSNQLHYQRLEDEDLFHQIVQILVSGGVVGWFQGRAEFGPRALGGRSILADPRRTDAKELLNEKIKRRENFRPFAPSILEEYVDEYFELTDSVPFMEKVFPIREAKRHVIPAVTHVDGTGRLQTVSKIISPKYYGLIDAFRKTTGIPILLNTSFNENEPIVNTPQQAIDCFMRTKMDILVLENCMIKRDA